MEEKTMERDELLGEITKLAESYPGDLLIQDVTPTESDGLSKGAIGLIAIAATAVVGGTVYGIKKIREVKARKRERLKESLWQEIMDEMVIDPENSDEEESEK